MLLDDISDFSRLDSGTLRLNPVATDLPLFLQSLVERMRVLSERHSITLVVGEVSQATVSVDQTRLEQVMVNLIANAVKHSPRGGPIEVTLRIDSKGVHIAVSDRGIGIPEPDLPRIFDRQYGQIEHWDSQPGPHSRGRTAWPTASSPSPSIWMR